MSAKLFVGTLLIFVLATNSLNLRTAFAAVHLQTTEEKQAYLKSLLKIEDQLLSNVESLQKSVHENNDKLQEFESQDAISGVFLEDIISDERNRIKDMENGLVLPLGLKTWECKSITQEQADRIHNQIVETQKQINSLSEKLDSQEPCKRNNEVEKQIQFLKLYLNHLMVQLSNKCSSEVSTKVFYIPNSGVSNYIYGDGITKDDYLKQVSDKRDQGFTSIECPVATPFPGQGKCVHCEQGQYFDLSKKQCLECSSDLWFDSIAKQCAAAPFNNNDDVQNYYGPLPAAIPGREACEGDTPYYDGSNCVACALPSYFDFNDYKCKVCADGREFDVNTHTCGYIKKNSNPEQGLNFCCGTLPHDDSLQDCPKESPFFNGVSCISCAAPGFFSLQSSKCSICPSGQLFSIKAHECIDAKYLTPYYQSNLTPQNQNYYGEPPTPDEDYELLKDCSDDTPFTSDGKDCVACALPYYYNFETQQCELCGEGKKFDTVSKKCVFLNTDQYNNNMVYIDNFIGKVPAYDPNQSTCPQQKPFFNGNECIQCKLPSFVDFDKNECRYCEDGQKFDTFNRQCLKTPPGYYTDLEADNIFYNGEWSNIKQRIEQQKSENPDIEKCPKNEPYYNAVKGECISCPEDYPLFDIKYNRCIACTGDSEYNADRRICVLPGSVKATIERMMMNTISWV